MGLQGISGACKMPLGVLAKSRTLSGTQQLALMSQGRGGAGRAYPDPIGPNCCDNVSSSLNKPSNPVELIESHCVPH